jgi:hypothetical protein
MKLVRIICLLLLTQCSLQAQTEDIFINANAEASHKVFDNSILDFYTTNELKLETIVIPINTRFSATVKLIGGRAFFKVRSIKIREEVYVVDWRVLGPDYKEGIPIIEADRNFEIYENQRLTFKTFSN